VKGVTPPYRFFWGVNSLRVIRPTRLHRWEAIQERLIGESWIFRVNQVNRRK
jgi:hypothetical protein